MSTFYPMSNHIALQCWQPLLAEITESQLNKRINKLKRLCDPDSSPEIDCYLNRVRSHPPLKYRKTVQINYRSLAEQTRSPWARAECQQRPKVDVHATKSEFDLLNVDIPDNMIRPEAFFYFCGLSFVSQPAEIIASRACIDGGAYRGETAVALRKMLPNSTVYSFEPDPQNYATLVTVASTTKYGDGIIAINKGLGASSYRVEATNPGHGTQLIRSSKSGAVQVTSIDEHASSIDAPIGFIKLDIEGLETAAIQGAVETIRKHRPLLSVAIYHNPVDFFDLAPYIESLNLGYTLMVRHLHPQLTSFFGEFNLIAVPK